MSIGRLSRLLCPSAVFPDFYVHRPSFRTFMSIGRLSGLLCPSAVFPDFYVHRPSFQTFMSIGRLSRLCAANVWNPELPTTTGFQKSRCTRFWNDGRMYARFWNDGRMYARFWNGGRMYARFWNDGRMYARFWNDDERCIVIPELRSKLWNPVVHKSYLDSRSLAALDSGMTALNGFATFRNDPKLHNP